MSLADLEIRIYVADLADYNNGELRGRWFDLVDFDDKARLLKEIQTMLAERGHEEWAVHDYDFRSPFGEYPDFDELFVFKEIAEASSLEIAVAYANQYGPGNLSLDKFQESFVGIYESEEDYAHSYIEDCYDLEKMMGNLAFYFDFEKFARDIFLCDMDSVRLSDGRVAVFYNH